MKPDKYKSSLLGFPGGAVVESLPANAGDTGSSPGPGRSHMPRSNWAREPHLLNLCVWSLCSATREAATVRGLRTAMKSGPRLPQLEKALAQKRRPNTAKNKLKKKKKKVHCSQILLLPLFSQNFLQTVSQTSGSLWFFTSPLWYHVPSHFPTHLPIFGLIHSLISILLIYLYLCLFPGLQLNSYLDQPVFIHGPDSLLDGLTYNSSPSAESLLIAQGRKNNFPSTLLGSWLRSLPQNKRQINTRKKQKRHNMYTP